MLTQGALRSAAEAYWVGAGNVQHGPRGHVLHLMSHPFLLLADCQCLPVALVLAHWLMRCSI